MKAVVTGKEMKMIDSYTIMQIGIPSLVLMERAAWSMVCHMIPDLDKMSRVLCLCGSGNNGGDAVAAARILYGMGYDASICMIGSKDKWTEETRKQNQIARNTGVPEYNEIDVDIDAYDIIVDGLFGIGLSTNVRAPYDQWIDRINDWRIKHRNAKVWSVDIPSGVSSDTGQVLGTAVKADYTVTFGCMKCGMILYPGRDLAGKCFVEDIGFPQKAIEETMPKGFYLEDEDGSLMPVRCNDSNKGDYGKILIIAGSKNMSGAACFSAKASYAAGAGLVRILTEEANRVILQTQLPQAMISVWEEMTDDELRVIIEWADAVVIGPGIGTADVMEKRLERTLSRIHCPTVIDADALNLLTKNPHWYTDLPKNAVVTPHMGEMSRLTRRAIQEIKADRSKAVCEYSNRYSVTCVLKDSSTVISDGKRLCYNRTGNHGMATGGSGDVLAGIIGTLLGSGMDSFTAACLGTYLHGCAGDWAGRIYGKRSMTSMELLDGLGNVLKSLEDDE